MKHLRILVEDGEYEDFLNEATSQGLSVEEWVLRSLRNSLKTRWVQDLKRRTDRVSKRERVGRMKKIREIARKGNAPTGDIEELLGQIKKGYCRFERE